MAKRGHGEGSVEYDKKRKCFYVKVSYKDPVTGETKRKKLKGGKTKTESLKIGQKWLEKIENGLLPGANKITLGEWIDRWIEDYVKNKVRQKSFDKYEGCLRLYVKPQLGGVLMSKINGPDVQRLLNKLLTQGGKAGTGISTSTVKATRRYLSMCLDKAVKVGLLNKNVVKDTDPPKLIKKEITPLTEEQAKALINKAKEAGDTPHMAILLAASSGMRLGEVFGLRWRDVDLEKGVIHVQQSLVTTSKGQKYETPKTPKSRRRISIPDNVTEELRQYKLRQDELIALLGDKWKGEGLVIANQLGGAYDTSNFTSRVFKKLLVEAGIDRSFKFHDLRHTHATLLLRRGINPKVVQERLGHSTITMTLDTYSHLLPDMQDTAVKALEGVFEKTEVYLIAA